MYSLKLRAVLLLLAVPVLAQLSSTQIASGQPACAVRQADVDALRNRALEEGQTGKTSDAIRDYQCALALQPGWKEGWWNLGMLEYSIQEFPDARSAFHRAATLAPRVGRIWALLGLSEYEVIDYDKALDHLELAQTLGIQDDEEIARVANYHIGLLLVRSGQFERALKMLRANFPSNTISPQIALVLGMATLRIPLLPQQLNPSKDALVTNVGRAASSSDLDKLAFLMKANPDAPNLRLAYEEARAGNKVEAQLQTLVASETGVLEFYANSDVKAGSTSTATQNVWKRALSEYVAADYAKAESDLETWLAANSSDGTAWAMLGLCEFAERDYDNALAHLDRSARLGMHASAESIDQARYAYGILLVRARRFEEADSVLATVSINEKVEFALGLSLLRRAELPEVVDLHDSDLIRAAGKISVLLQNSKYDEAFPLFRKLLQHYPAVPFLHYAYGTALLAVSNFDQASAEMQVERTISPKSELSCLRLASIALRQHDAERAIPWAQCALELNRDATDAHYLLGRALLETGDAENAIRELETAEKLSPASPEIHFNLAKAYTKAKLPEKAQHERETFTELNQASQTSSPKADER